jgi:hypothetical protein
MGLPGVLNSELLNPAENVAGVAGFHISGPTAR